MSYIGYQTVEVKAEPEMTIYLDEDTGLLDELVVVGYQTVKKTDLTGAISVMDMKDPISENSGNIMSSMAGNGDRHIGLLLKTPVFRLRCRSTAMELIGSDIANPLQLIENAADNDLQSWRILATHFLRLNL